MSEKAPARSRGDKPSVHVLGGGAWGTALATLMAARNGSCLQWARDAKTVAQINKEHRNTYYLGDIPLNDGLSATTDLAATCDCDVLLCVTPAQTLAQLAPVIASHVLPHTLVVLCAKGIDAVSGKLPHQVFCESVDPSRVAALSGPSFAHDVAAGLPTAVSCAASDMQTAQRLARTLSTPLFRIYASDDLMGVEAGGALKNVLALSVGAARGLGLGASAEAALIARGFAEIVRLATAMGGRAETLSGLSGLGDLVLTCSSPQSRNFSYGMALGSGRSVEGLKLAEGAHTARIAARKAVELGVDVPIINSVCAVLDNKMTARDALHSLLARPLRSEIAAPDPSS